MLASCPVSTVNQNTPDSGIPTDSAQSHPALDLASAAKLQVAVKKTEAELNLIGRASIAFEISADAYGLS